MEDIELKRFIERGKFGEVYIARNKNPKYPQEVAVKIIKKKILRMTQTKYQKEIEILEMLDNPYIIKFFYWDENDSNIFHILEFIPGGDLYAKIENTCLDEKTSLKYLKQLAKGVSYLHENHIMHRDIKPENILIDKNNNLKITDFGHAIIFEANDIFNKIVGTPYYLSPEMLTEQMYDYRIDIWMIGVVYYEMLIGEPPFHGENEKEIIRKIVAGKYHIPKTLSDKSRFNILDILQSNPYKRATLKYILKM